MAMAPPRAHRKRPVTTAGRRVARKAAAAAAGPTPGPPKRSRSTTADRKAPPASPRFASLHADLDAHLRRLFPDLEAVEAYGMRGWRVRRPRAVPWTHGTIDPNLVQVFLAERSQGTSLHLWNPYDPGLLSRRKDALAAAGFKVMVGCLQFNRKSAYPVALVAGLFEEIAAAAERERRRWPDRKGA